MKVILLISCLAVIEAEYYDTFTGLRITKQRYDDLQRAGLNPVCATEIQPCDSHEFRRVDGTCNSLKYPQRGAQFTPFRRLLDPAFSADGGLPVSSDGSPLPPPRPLRVALMSDGRLTSNHSLLVAMFMLIVVADVTSVHDTVNYVAVTRSCCEGGGDQDPRCIPVMVPDDDPHLRATSVRCLNLTRSITYGRVGCVPPNTTPERINLGTPMLDLSIVYGNTLNESQQTRAFRGGLMLADVISGKEWPPTGGVVCVNNVPPLETRCHNIPAGANSLLGINMVYLWLFRHHNYLARHLATINPCWSDDTIYHVAREINIATVNNIHYSHLMKELLGYDFLASNGIVSPSGGHIDDYDETLEPRVSVEYVTTLRWMHTLQEGRHRLYTPEGTIYGELATVDMILRTGALALNNTLGGLTQGSFRQRGAGVDRVVDPDLGERVLGRLQFVSDVVSSDIMKGRDLGLSPYNSYRQLCGLKPAKTFDDLKEWMDEEHVQTFARFYKSPSDIELMSALLTERPSPGGVLPPTLACIVGEQMLHWRRADRLWYERPGRFTEEQLLEIRKMTLSKLLCLHGDSVKAVQPQAFLVPGPGNEITDCSNYEMPNFDVFKDDSCHMKSYMRANHVKLQEFSGNNSKDSKTVDDLPNEYGYSFGKPLNCEKCSLANPFEKYFHYY